MKKTSKLLFLALTLFALFAMFCGCSAEEAAYWDEYLNSYVDTVSSEAVAVIDENGSYTSPEEVAAYLRTYNKLPSNFITKSEAQSLGWVSSEGNLWEVTDKKSIGGDRFGNREGRLPNKEGRIWYECDVNYNGGYRGEERIVYSNDGLIYYTNDHYETFTLME